MDIDSLVVPIQRSIERRGLKVLVIGKSKTGKTRFSIEAPEPILFIDTEYSVSGYKSLIGDKKIDVINLMYVNEKYEMDSERMVDVLEKIAGKLHKDWRGKYKSIVIDSGTTLWKIYQDWLRHDVINVGGKINKKGVPVDRRDWGKANSRYEGLMSLLISLPTNVILTIQEQPEYDSKNNLIGYKPVMQKRTEYFFDIHIQLEKKGKEFLRIVKECRQNVNLESQQIRSFNDLEERIYGKDKSI